MSSVDAHAECGPCRVRRRTQPLERALATTVALGAFGALAVIFGGSTVLAAFGGNADVAVQSTLGALAIVALTGAALLALLVSLVEPWMLGRAKGIGGNGPAYRHTARCRRCGIEVAG